MTDTNDDDPPAVSLETEEEIDWLAKGRQEAGVSDAEARREYTMQATKELLQAAGDPVDAEASAADLNAAHSDFRDAVNMTADDLQAWGNHNCSEAASVKPAEVRQRVRDLLTTPTDNWGAEDVEDARLVADFISRLREAPQGDPVRDGCPPARDVTLMNWGYRPDTTDLED
jgi:hypothetical protein